MTRAGRTELVVATGNAGKLREIRELLGTLDVELTSLADHRDVRMPEEGDEYEANAIVKARSVAEATGRLAVADDSGLEVTGLGGRPGPHSARYGGPDLDDAGRVRHLLDEIAGLPGADPDARRARFVCVAALATPEGETETFLGTCDGRILEAVRGAGGFGYDPVFQPDGEAASMAELPASTKNSISHRARAFAALLESLERRLDVGEGS